MQEHQPWIRAQLHTATRQRAIPRLDSIAAQSCTGVIQTAAILGNKQLLTLELLIRVAVFWGAKSPEEIRSNRTGVAGGHGSITTPSLARDVLSVEIHTIDVN